MDPIEVYKTSFEEMIFTVAKLLIRRKSTRQSIEKIGMETGRSRLYNYCELHWNYDSFIRRLLNK
jgi:hypothetical protein